MKFNRFNVNQNKIIPVNLNKKFKGKIYSCKFE